MRTAHKLFVTTVLLAVGAAAQAPDHALATVYLEGQKVPFLPGAGDAAHKVIRLGSWTLAPKATEAKPLDKRMNLYLVFPGAQYASEGSAFDHNALVNLPPKNEDAEREWDVFYCFVLDPHLHDDIINERDLLLLAQQRWVPGDLFEFDDLPAADALRELNKAQTVPSLTPWRHKNDGSLPRVIILSAGFAVRGALGATAAPPK
jgi:hypothetical protein